ncbi:MAG: PHP domain-containing protein [Clostridia bacterium]|nr:PHP domain-containing protein [Clostridia bacterium]
MSLYRCDLHIHSCLSPCGDDDMTPANIVGMAMLNGLQVIALTDHNTTKNCPAFFKLAKGYGLIPVAGVELTTNEDVHAVCLFRDLETAMEFGRFIEGRRVQIKNNPDIFGRQIIMDENDEKSGEEEFLLINAVNISLDEAHEEVARRGGVCFPAHIDRSSNGIIAMLGDFPPEPRFTAFELNDIASLEDCLSRFPIIGERGLVHVASSDAHYLTDISETGFGIELDDEPYSSDRVRNALIDYLLGKGNCNNGRAFALRA